MSKPRNYCCQLYVTSACHTPLSDLQIVCFIIIHFFKLFPSLEKKTRKNFMESMVTVLLGRLTKWLFSCGQLTCYSQPAALRHGDSMIQLGGF